MRTLYCRAFFRPLVLLLVAGATFVMFASLGVAQRQMENLGRGLVAVRQEDGTVFVGWRLLGTDPEATSFNLYRSANGEPAVKLNFSPHTNATHFVDRTAELEKTNAYFLKPVVKGKELSASAAFVLPANSPVRQYLSVPLQPPAGTTPNDISVGDLDGDGEYEIVIHMAPRGRDNSRGGVTEPPIFQAYKLDGTLLWTINLGRNIREGAHYTQFMVYDLDGDGKAEMACKTADGTVDGKGKVIGDANANWRSPNGHILSGPEFLTIFDGWTGAALATASYIPTRHPTKRDPSSDELREVWGDGNGNRSERYLACIAYLDGKRPSLVMCRGYYARTVLAAWNWREGKLKPVWTFDSDASPDNRAFRGQGNHNLSVGDVDDDGKDEIVYGACVIDHNGKGLYSTRLGHGDAIHFSDLDPEHPGLEVFDIQERVDDAGAHFRDAKTGKNLWKKPTASGEPEGPGRGMAADIDPRHKGAEMWAGGEGGVQGLFNTKGELVSPIKPRTCNFAVWWDGDLIRELLNGNRISKWDWQNSSEETIFEAEDCTSNNGSKSTPALSADILGDWREEVIWRTRDNRELRIYTTTIPTEHRFYTLMHDPQYRLAIAWQNVAYNQPPHPGFYLGDGMKSPPRPKITTQTISRLAR